MRRNVYMVAIYLIFLGLNSSHAAEDLVSRLKDHHISCATPKAEARAIHCQAKFDGYSQRVHIYLPRRTRPRPGLLYYLHGFWLDAGTDPFVGEHGNFVAALSEAARNAIIIVPESRGYNEDYRTQFASSDKLNIFITNVESRLNSAGLNIGTDNPRLLAGHSAAYVTLAQIGTWLAAGELPALANLSGVALLDTAYGYRPGLLTLLDVICKNQSHAAVYYQAFNPADGARDKYDTNLKINDEATHAHACARARHIFLTAPNLLHMDFPRTFLGQFLSVSLDSDEPMASEVRVPLGRAPAGALHYPTM